VPRPRHNLVRYHGVLARGCLQPNAKIRKLIVPKNNKRLKKVEDKGDDKKHNVAEEAASRNELVAPLTWAQRRDGEPLKRVFERAAIGSILPYAPCVAELCVLSDGAAFGSLTQT
jgi:hypothetical protein